ncbi:hypothetical protein L7F22_042430 [Adiantum nelumboides]|nr:hypothetical protein [Adiantum nelumboides]
MRRRVRRPASYSRRERFKGCHWRVIYKRLAVGRRKGVTMQCYYGGGSRRGALERIERLARENAVVVFSVSSCCMCHVVKRLFCSLGVSPTVYELDELDEMGSGQQLKEALAGLVGDPAVPAVFIGGKLVGGLDRVMATHISGSLIPLLKEAGALWL